MAQNFFDWEDEVQRLGARADDLFDHVIGLASAPRYKLQESWRPAVDVYEVDAGLMVVAELPGVDERDLQVTTLGARLRIAGVRRPPRIEHCKQPWQLEIEYGPFERLVVLPGDVDADGITAHFRHGLLAVHVPWQNRKRTVRVCVTEPSEFTSDGDAHRSGLSSSKHVLSPAEGAAHGGKTGTETNER